MVGMTMLETTTSIPLQPCLAYINQPKVLVVSENYLYNIYANRITRQLEGEA
jgi:hypothetical protein